ncbi:MAG TPA: type II toxin-antitoxin system prevent-host-death family antitoxin [Methylibium sp.]|nr:type II toxin-antitoxin system prevent-host-death family antitoxin [Methylibium sp.]
MEVTATDAKNRLGQMLEACQREPVIIEKSGRRHSVLLSASHYDALVAAAKAPAADALPPPRTADEFYARYKDWVDEQNARFERIGIWNEEFRRW